MARNRKTPKTDPTKSGRLILSYEKKLIGYVKTYNALVKRAVLIASGERLLESPIKPHTETTLIKSVTKIGEVVANEAEGDITKHAMQSYKHGVTFAQSTMNLPSGDALTTGISFNLPVARETMARLANRQNAAFKGITDDMSKHIIREISDGVQRGEGIPQLTARIEDITDNIGRVRAETIARTETMTAVNQGSIDQYKQSGFTKLEWLAALDERTCTRPIEWMGIGYLGCGGLNGKVFDIDKFPPLPAHPNCRCTSIPVMGE